MTSRPFYYIFLTLRLLFSLPNQRQYWALNSHFFYFLSLFYFVLYVFGRSRARYSLIRPITQKRRLLSDFSTPRETVQTFVELRSNLLASV